MEPERGTLAVVRRLQEVDPRYGLHPQRQADAEALLAASTTVLVESEGVSVPRWTPPIDGASLLLVPPGLPYTPLRYAHNLVAAMHRLRTQPPRIAVTAALVGILNVEDTQRKGEAFIRRKRAALEAIPGLFREYDVDELFAISLAVRDRLALQPEKPRREPKSAAYYLELGRAARCHRQYRVALKLLKRSLLLAKNTREHLIAARALLNIGITWRVLENAGHARAVLERAAKMAELHGLAEMHGAALHELSALAFGRGDLAGSDALSIRAFWIYPADCPRRVALLHDVAFTWMERGYNQSALTTFLGLLRHDLEAPQRAGLYANIARAAVGAGRNDLYEEYWPRAEAACSTLPDHHEQSQALVDLTIAHCGTGAFDRAILTGERAIRAARHAGEVMELQEAETWLLVATERRPIAWLAPPPRTDIDEFAEVALAALSTLPRT